MSEPKRQVASVHLLIEHEYASASELLDAVNAALYGKPVTVLASRWELNGAVSPYVQEGVNALRQRPIAGGVVRPSLPFPHAFEGDGAQCVLRAGNGGLMVCGYRRTDQIHMFAQEKG